MKKCMLALMVAGILTVAGCKKAEQGEGPQPFKAESGTAMGPISAIDAAKNEIIIGDDIIAISPADIARLKVGDEVTVEVHGSKVTVKKAGDKVVLAPFSGLSGHVMGPVESIDTVKNELVVNATIFKLKPADIAGLKVGDSVKVTVTETKTTVTRMK